MLDYFWTSVNGGRGRQHLMDGTTVEHTYLPGETRHETYGPGEFKVHDLENLGDEDMIFNTIEFLDSANKPLPMPDSVRAQPAVAGSAELAHPPSFRERGQSPRARRSDDHDVWGHRFRLALRARPGMTGEMPLSHRLPKPARHCAAWRILPTRAERVCESSTSQAAKLPAHYLPTISKKARRRGSARGFSG